MGTFQLVCDFESPFLGSTWHTGVREVAVLIREPPCEPDAFEVKIFGNDGLTGSVLAGRLTTRLPIW